MGGVGVEGGASVAVSLAQRHQARRGVCTNNWARQGVRSHV